jgi:hypothetical protein
MITITFAAVAALCFFLAVLLPFTSLNSGRLNLVALGLFFLAMAHLPAWNAWGAVK